MIINFDLQKGKYFRINKKTGEQAISERDGSELKKFKSSYTGSDYKTRKLHEPNLSPRSLKSPQFKIILPHKYTKTLNKKKSSNKSSVQSTKKINFFESNITNEDKKEQNFQRKMKEYSKIFYRNETFHSNYSNKQNINQFPHIAKTLVHSSGLNIKRKQASYILPEILSQKSQLTRQKLIFLQYNSQHSFKEKEKKVEELRERKKNLKILEKQFLNEREKITNKVYE